MQNSNAPPIGHINVARDGHGRALALTNLNVVVPAHRWLANEVWYILGIAMSHDLIIYSCITFC